MSTQSALVDFEPIIWARLLEAQVEAQNREISPDVARFLLSMSFADRDRERIAYLADRSQAGELSTEEEAEFDSYLHIGNLLTMMKSKARLILGFRQPSPEAS